MRKKRRKQEAPERALSGFDRLPSPAEFYAGAPAEQPLLQDRPVSGAHRVSKTARHIAVAGRRRDGVDPREKMALLAILRTVVMVLLLAIAFFMLRKGIALYEESIWIGNQSAAEPSPVMREVAVVADFDIGSAGGQELFDERIAVWKEAERLMRSADALLLRNNIDQAIARCQDALQLVPSHRGALSRLGSLYLAQGRHVESVNAYIRLLSIDPASKDVQKDLVRALDLYGDPAAVISMAKWYLDQNVYDADVQRYMANALFAEGEYAAATEAYGRVLQDAPGDRTALEQQAKAYMVLGQYEKALAALDLLREVNYREPTYYRQIAVCNAQLGKGLETVQTLGRAAHLFGQNTVMGWIQDPQLDPVREDRTFQAFADRVGGEEFRKWLEQVARTMESEPLRDIAPQLKLPEQQPDQDLLRPRSRP